LEIAKCRLMTAVPINREIKPDRITVATKFTNIAKGYFAEQRRQVDLIKLNGALELAPTLGLADAIVDIVDTGKTLAANGLKPQNLIAEVSSRVIVNKASLKIKHEVINDILGKLSVIVKSGR